MSDTLAHLKAALANDYAIVRIGAKKPEGVLPPGSSGATKPSRGITVNNQIKSRMKTRQGAAVLAVGFEPTRIFIQRTVIPPRLPVSPRQHLSRSTNHRYHRGENVALHSRSRTAIGPYVFDLYFA